MQRKILVCIPAYNEAKNITNVIQKALPFCNEVIVCDDGSVDNTAEIAEKAGATVISHPVNKGYGSALKTLFNVAREKDADIMITIDSDGQHNPDQIPNVIKPIISNHVDIVLGSRFLLKDDKEIIPLYRTIGIKTITKLSQFITYNHITDAQSGFRAYNKKALSTIRLTQDGMSVSTEILVKAKESNLKIEEVPVTIRYDVEDASTYNPISHGLGVMIAIVKFVSIKHPLTFYAIPGLIFLGLAAMFAVNLVSFLIEGKSPTTNVVILTIGPAVMGVVLVATGAILYSFARISNSR